MQQVSHACVALLTQYRDEVVSLNVDRSTPKLSEQDLLEHLQALPAWQLNETKTSLARSFTAKNFVAGDGTKPVAVLQLLQ